MAALLKAYTPVTWARLDDLIVDDPGVARKLGKTIRPYSTVPSSHDRMILLATHPRTQASLATRISQDGHSTLVWNDIIER